jgi:hypothetical protein
MEDKNANNHLCCLAAANWRGLSLTQDDVSPHLLQFCCNPIFQRLTEEEEGTTSLFIVLDRSGK